MIRSRRPFLFLMSAVCMLTLISGASRVQAADVLCPEVDAEKKNTPRDIAGVQADIERLNLCVERAKLLKQLDEVVKQREEMLRKVTDPTMGLPSAGLGVAGIPSLPVAALPAVPGIDTSTLKPGEIRVTGPGGAPLAPASPVRVASEWKIRKIWGQGAGMNAQLTDSQGVLLNIQKGNPLPDGQVVESISGKGVTVSQNGKITDLSWDDAPVDVSTAGGPRAP